MKIKFTKMHGCGNDYIYFDCMNGLEIQNPGALSVRLSDRHRGIGGDGVILICPSDAADARMRMFNADGSEGRMCGNGIRCVGKYLHDSGTVRGENMTVETLSGVRSLRVVSEDNQHSAKLLEVNMGQASTVADEIPIVNVPKGDVVGYPVVFGEQKYRITCVSMGNPHCVVFCEDVDDIELSEIGPLFEKSEIFPDGVNTEFVQVVNESTLRMRVWERGSGETFACGTGACAAVVASVLNGLCDKGHDVKVQLRGGELSVRYTDDAVLLTGGAEKVFEGVVEI